MQERLTQLTSEDVKKNLVRIEPKESYSDMIAQELGQTVFDQEDACKAVGRRLAMFETGLIDPQKPLGSMFFLGPSGTGKTEMAHATAKYMFGDAHSDRLKIINMAEMQEDHYVTKFVGSPPSYVGYGEKPLIPHDWLHKGRSVIVLDEFEKAAPAVKQLFLGVLDKGRMESRAGQEGNKTLDFRESVIIFTSNIAGTQIHRIMEGTRLGFGDRRESSETKNQHINQEARQGMKSVLSPEFINRLDDIVVFKEIQSTETYKRMVNKFLSERNEHLIEAMGTNAPYFAITQEFRDFVLELTGKQGGRELKRVLDRELFDMGADVVMGMDVRGKPLVADREKDATFFYTTDNPPLHIEPPIPEVKLVESGKKKDPGSNIGNKPPTDFEGWDDEYTGKDDEIPSEKDTGEEDIKKPKTQKKAPKRPSEEYSLVLTYEDGTTEEISGLDDVISDLLMGGLAENPEWNGKRVKSARNVQKPREKQPDLSFLLPAEGVIFDSMDIAITIRAGGHQYGQVIEGMPIIKVK